MIVSGRRSPLGVAVIDGAMEVDCGGGSAERDTTGGDACCSLYVAIIVAGSTPCGASSVTLGGPNDIFCCCNTEGQLLRSVTRWQHRYERGALAMGATRTAQFFAM